MEANLGSMILKLRELTQPQNWLQLHPFHNLMFIQRANVPLALLKLKKRMELFCLYIL